MLTLASPLSSHTSRSLKPQPPPSVFTISLSRLRPLRLPEIPTERKTIKVGPCRAEFQQDAPFAAAIGACMLSSLVLPNGLSGSDEDKESVVDSTDTRFAVMGIISFIPYFNWLSWVFAWLDTGKRRYAIYALVYLAPYLRTNMVISPEESWLPIASIIFGIVHVQLEASIRNGDIEKFQLFSKVTEILSSLGKKKDIDYHDHHGQSEEGREGKERKLPSAEEQPRNEIRNWGVPRKPSEDHEHSTSDRDDRDDNERREQ